MSITSTANGAAAGNLRAAAGAWDPVEFHEAAGARLAISRRGRGVPVVCLHATGHGARDFELLADRVGEAFEIIAVDWPGQGRSPREATPASAARYAQILEELVPLVAGEPVILIGCSIGGAAAIQLSARRPDLVRALVVCDSGGLVALDAPTRFFMRCMTAFFTAGARGAAWFPAAFSLYYRMVLPGPAARPQRDRIVASCREIAPILTESWSSFAAADADIRALVPSVHCPTLIAWARQDRVIAWTFCKAAAQRFPDYRLEFFQAGHAAFLEDPDRFADVFRSFAARIPEPVVQREALRAV